MHGTLSFALASGSAYSDFASDLAVRWTSLTLSRRSRSVSGKRYGATLCGVTMWILRKKRMPNPKHAKRAEATRATGRPAGIGRPGETDHDRHTYIKGTEGPDAGEDVESIE